MKYDPKVAAAAAALLQRQTQTRPVHLHTCPGEGEKHLGHQWPCPSTYCQPDTTLPGTLLYCPGHSAGTLPAGTREEDFLSDA